MDGSSDGTDNQNSQQQQQQKIKIYFIFFLMCFNLKENIFCQNECCGIQWTGLLTEQPQQQAAAAKKKDPF
jgi:hypothetical protein